MWKAVLKAGMSQNLQFASQDDGNKQIEIYNYIKYNDIHSVTKKSRTLVFIRLIPIFYLCINYNACNNLLNKLILMQSDQKFISYRKIM